MSSHYLRFHVKQVAHGHVGVALAVAVSLREQLFLGPGHVNPLGPGLGLVIYGAMRCRVSVMNELSLIGETYDKIQKTATMRTTTTVDGLKK